MADNRFQDKRCIAASVSSCLHSLQHNILGDVHTSVEQRHSLILVPVDALVAQTQSVHEKFMALSVVSFFELLKHAFL